MITARMALIIIFIISFPVSVLAETKNETKNYSGLWATSFGPMVLVQKGDSVSGFYVMQGEKCSLDGKIKAGKLQFTYKEKKAHGEGWFEIAKGQDSFSGQWKAAGQDKWDGWVGARIKPQPGKMWLVVLEANWESSLDEREYAFGDMLKAFFDRTQNVEVRRRKFSDGPSLKARLEEIALLPEPVVVSIASHGETDGLTVEGKIIPASVVAEGLKYAVNMKALHFSSCLVMQKSFGREVFKLLKDGGIQTTVSGYKKSVDWAASALFEMNYFDLILSRGMAAPKASKTALIMYPALGAKQLKDSPVAPAGFEALF